MHPYLRWLRRRGWLHERGSWEPDGSSWVRLWAQVRERERVLSATGRVEEWALGAKTDARFGLGGSRPSLGRVRMVWADLECVLALLTDWRHLESLHLIVSTIEATRVSATSLNRLLFLPAAPPRSWHNCKSLHRYSLAPCDAFSEIPSGLAHSEVPRRSCQCANRLANDRDKAAGQAQVVFLPVAFQVCVQASLSLYILTSAIQTGIWVLFCNPELT